MQKLTPVVGKVFNARHLRRHHGAQNGEHLGCIVATECWVQGIAICLGITAVLGSQVPREIDEWPPLFRLAANGKAAITDTASIGESRGSCGWCYDVVLRTGIEIDCYNDHMIWLPNAMVPREAHAGLFKWVTLLYLPFACWPHKRSTTPANTAALFNVQSSLLWRPCEGPKAK